jgi:hypothetical protein
VYQTTAYVIQQGDNIGLKVDARSTWQADRLRLALFYEDDAHRKMPIVDAQVAPADTMAQYSCSFHASDLPASVGHRLGVLFDNVSSNPSSWVALDNVSLFKLTPTGIAESPARAIGFALQQNYPNPFNPSTTIRYALPHPDHVKLEVFNVLGQRVAVLVDERKAAGRYEITFDAGALPSGVYVYRITTGDYVSARKSVLLK